EDVALAQAYVRHHLDIFLTHAAQFMSVRMYSSLAEIVEGWTKNLALGVPLMFPPLPLVRRAAPYLMWLPALCWVLPPLFWAVYEMPPGPAPYKSCAASATTRRTGPRRRDRSSSSPAPRTTPPDRSHPRARRNFRSPSTRPGRPRAA